MVVKELALEAVVEQEPLVLVQGRLQLREVGVHAEAVDELLEPGALEVGDVHLARVRGAHLLQGVEVALLVHLDRFRDGGLGEDPAVLRLTPVAVDARTHEGEHPLTLGVEAGLDGRLGARGLPPEPGGAGLLEAEPAPEAIVDVVDCLAGLPLPPSDGAVRDPHEPLDQGVVHVGVGQSRRQIVETGPGRTRAEDVVHSFSPCSYLAALRARHRSFSLAGPV